MTHKPDYKPETDNERALFKVMTSHMSFTHQDLRSLTDVTDWARSNFVSKLRRLGILQDCGRQGSTIVMTVMDAQAVQSFAAEKRKTKPGQMWTTMRSLVTFSTDDLEAVLLADDLGITQAEIQKYCTMLVRAEYLIVLEKAKPGRTPARYRLVNNSGPLPPIERHLACIVDQNEERAVRVSGVRI